MDINLLYPDIESFTSSVGGGHNTNTIEAMSGFITEALTDPIAEIFSEEFVDEVFEYLEDPSGYSAEEIELLDKVVQKIRVATANLAYMNFASEGGVQVDDTGFHQLNNTETRQAYQWQMMNFKRAKEKAGWKAIRSLYRFLLKHSDESIFESFFDSDNYTMLLSKLVLQNDSEFSQFVNIEGFETFYHLRNHIHVVQQETLQLLLTEDVYDEVIEWVNDEPEDAKLFWLCQKVVATATLLEAIPVLPFKVHNSGLIISEFIVNRDNSSQHTQAIDNTHALVQKARKDFERAKHDLSSYMWKTANATTYQSFYQEKMVPLQEAKMTRADIAEKNTRANIVGL